MTTIDYLAIACAALCIVGYVCRYGLLVAWQHNPAICALHVALGGLAADVIVKAAAGATDLQSVLCLVASGGWIWISRSSWPNGVPAHYLRRRLELVQRKPERNVARIKP